MSLTLMHSVSWHSDHLIVHDELYHRHSSAHVNSSHKYMCVSKFDFEQKDDRINSF